MGAVIADHWARSTPDRRSGFGRRSEAHRRRRDLSVHYGVRRLSVPSSRSASADAVCAAARSDRSSPQPFRLGSPHPFDEFWRRLHSPTDPDPAAPDDRLGSTSCAQLGAQCSSAPHWDLWGFATTASPRGSGWRSYESSQLTRPTDLTVPPIRSGSALVHSNIAPTCGDPGPPRRAGARPDRP